MKLMFETFIGVIGGSGLYGIRELEHQEWKTVDTPLGSAVGPTIVWIY